MSNLIVILKKELKDIFRDKKTIIFTLLLPIVIYPALFALMDFSIKDSAKKIEEGIKIGLVDKGNSEIAMKIKNDKRFIVSKSDNIDEELKKGNITAIIEIPDDFNSKVKEEKSSGIKIIYDEASNMSLISVERIKGYLEEYSKKIVDSRIEKRGLDKELINPFKIEAVTNNKDNKESNPIGTALANMLPTFILLFMFMPTMGVSADLGAGEKERGTLEPLLSTAVKRSSILWGKVSAIVVVAFIALMVTVSAMLVSLNVLFDNASKSLSLNPISVLLILVFCILFLIALASVEMAVSIFSRSMKEANSYLTGLMVVSMIFIYIPMMMDSKSIKSAYFNVPITNIVCIIKEFTVGIYNVGHILVVLAWVVLYIAIAISFARYMFKREEVVFRA